MCPLTEQGVAEAHSAGRQIREAGIEFDAAWTSLLKRAIHTLWIILDEIDAPWLTVQRDWRLNERHYGSLQGLNKAETAATARRRSGPHLAPLLRHPAAALGTATIPTIPASTAATPRFPPPNCRPPNRSS